MGGILKLNHLSRWTTLSLVIYSILFPVFLLADISETTRAEKAVVRYEFDESNVDTFLDSSHLKFGAHLDLFLKTAKSVTKGVDSSNDGYLSINSASVIRTSSPALKIYNACKEPTSTGVTIEAIVENNESVELRSGDFPLRINQPLRIVSYSRAFSNRDAQPKENITEIVNSNFAFGQFYKNGNLYMGAVTTGANGNLFSQPLQSENSVIMINGITRAAASYKQKIIFTTSKQGVARLYLSDRSGNLYPAKVSTEGFEGDVNQFTSRWASDAFLNVGNDFIPDASIISTLQSNDQFQSPTCTDSCANNPNRYWKGKIYRLAIYCEALTKEEIYGQAYQINKNEIFPMPSNFLITPSLQKAADIFERLTGTKTPIYNPLLQQMALRIEANDLMGAAQLITGDHNVPYSGHSMFYNVTVKNFAAKMSNRDETINTPLNDFTATIIGAVLDNLNAKTLLSDNYYYQGDPQKAAIPSDEVDDILKSNNHYQSLDLGGFDLKSVLVKKSQILFNGTSFVPNPSPSGLLTTRQWALSHMIAGTNRRAVEYSLREFSCTPMEQAADSSGPEDVISRDIDRNPAGSMDKFTNSCRACHTIMDGFRPAFAYMTFSNNFLKHSLLVEKSPANNANEDNSNLMRTHPDSPTVTRKMNHNEETFIGGRIVLNDKWTNNANNGVNKTNFGWKASGLSGTGITAFGRAIAESSAFPKCMAKRVFSTVCKREATSGEDEFISKVATEFSSSERNYNLKYLFERIVTDKICLGGN